jgi:hypothetical protein
VRRAKRNSEREVKMVKELIKYENEHIWNMYENRTMKPVEIVLRRKKVG